MNIKLWWVLLFIVIVVLLKKLNIKFESGKTENIELPSFYSYQSDTFKNGNGLGSGSLTIM